MAGFMRSQSSLPSYRRARGALAGVALCIAIGAAGSAAAQRQKAVPYWVALKSDEAKLRVGPSQDFPAKWLYTMPGLPLRVIQVDAKYPQWRKVEDPDGVRGWMHVSMLRDSPAAIVRGSMAEMRDKPAASAKLLYRIEPGVIGRVNSCADGWCAMDVRGQRGYVHARSLWGATD